MKGVVVKRVLLGLVSLCWLVAAVAVASAQARNSEVARERWQRVPDLVAAMNLTEGSRVADVGAGSGFLTVRLASAVGPSGRVYAVDIVPEVLKRLRERVATAGLTNVEVVEAREDDPRLPADSLNAIVMVNAYHEVPEYRGLLAHFRAALRSDGRLVLCEPRPTTPGAPREAQAKRHVLSPDFIVDELRQAGFEVVTRDDAFTANPSGPEPAPYSLVVAVKK
jgi:ubiquinone/menaquinone biosynthesis C-methylase UbiE